MLMASKILLLLLACAVTLAISCPPQYEQHEEKCYKYVREKTQWKMAQESCMNDGGNLVTLHSASEKNFLAAFLKKHEARFDDKYLHIGGYDYHANGVFLWIDTTTAVNLVTGLLWMPNNPRGQGRRCLASHLGEEQHLAFLADEYCWVSLPYVCKTDLI